jgi:hypothetical protein
MIGAAHLVENWQSGIQVDDNDVPFIDHWDARLSYKFDIGVTLYGAVDNVTFGRVWRVGLRARF